MAQVIGVQEFREEGIAIITDTEGKYVVSAHTDKIEVIPEVKHPFVPRNPCALVQTRDQMMT
jgi:hypothetical protein